MKRLIILITISLLLIFANAQAAPRVVLAENFGGPG